MTAPGALAGLSQTTSGEARRVFRLGDHAALAFPCAAMFNQVHPRRIAATGMTVFPGTPLADMVKSRAFVEAPEREKIEELLLFLENLSADTSFDAVHSLNALNYRFSVADGREKERVLEDILDVLRSHSDEELEMTASRHLVRSL